MTYQLLNSFFYFEVGPPSKSDVGFQNWKGNGYWIAMVGYVHFRGEFSFFQKANSCFLLPLSYTLLSSYKSTIVGKHSESLSDIHALEF